MKNSQSLYLLVAAFGAEVLCAHVVFIFLPLSVIASGGGDSVAANLRSLAYIGPVLFGYFIGKIVDLLNKRYLGCGIALALALMTVFFAIRYPHSSLVESCLLLLVISIGTYVLNNLRSSVVPLVATKAQLASVNSWLLITESFALIFAPVLAAFLLSAQTPNAGLFLISIVFISSGFLYFLSLSRSFPQRVLSSGIPSFRQNVRVLTANTRLLHLVFVVMGSNAFTGIYLLHILIYGIEIACFTSKTAPFLLAAFAIGAIISGVTAAIVLQRYGNQKVSLSSCALMVFAGVVPVFVPVEFSFYFSSFFVGFFESYIVIAVWTARQTLVPVHVLGSVTGITSMLFKLPMVIAIPIAGFLSETHGGASSILFGSFAVLFGAFPLAKNLIFEARLKA